MLSTSKFDIYLRCIIVLHAHDSIAVVGFCEQLGHISQPEEVIICKQGPTFEVIQIGDVKAAISKFSRLLWIKGTSVNSLRAQFVALQRNYVDRNRSISFKTELCHLKSDVFVTVVTDVTTKREILIAM